MLMGLGASKYNYAPTLLRKRCKTILSKLSTVGPQVTLFLSTLCHCNIDEMPQEHNSCLYQLPYGKIGFVYVISFKVAVSKNLMLTVIENLLQQARIFRLVLFILGTQHLKYVIIIIYDNHSEIPTDEQILCVTKMEVIKSHKSNRYTDIIKVSKSDFVFLSYKSKLVQN